MAAPADPGPASPTPAGGPPERGGLRRWGSWVARHPRQVLLTWLTLIVLSFATALGAFGNSGLFQRLDAGDIQVTGENQAGREVLGRFARPSHQIYTLLASGVDVTDPHTRAAGRRAARDLREIPGVSSVASPFTVPAGPLSRGAFPFLAQGSPRPGIAIVVAFNIGLPRATQATSSRAADVVFDRFLRESGATGSQRGGVRPLVDRIVAQVKTDGQRGEGIALPISFVVMIVVFGGLVAAAIPIAGAVASIGGALILLLGFSYVLPLDASVVNVVTVLGLGLCIDYGLLVVSRFREEIGRANPGIAPADLTREDIVAACAQTLHRAGRTVVFSGLIVTISLAGLMVFDIPFIRALSAAGVCVVLLAMAVGLTLAPAACVAGARRVLRNRPESSPDVGVFERLAHVVQRIPWVAVTVITTLLLLLALPAARMATTSSGGGLLPRGTPERVFFEDLSRHYPYLVGAQVVLVCRAPMADVLAFAVQVRGRPGVVSVDPPYQQGPGVVTLGIRTGDNGTGPDSRAAVASLRADRPPFESWTIGQAAALRDFTDVIRARAPLAALLVALATLVLLFLMTGSLVVPVKALVMNLLSLGATLGVLVWIFQKGNLSGLLRFTSNGAIESTVPVLVLAFGFGLSMDYEVFLLSRIVELHEQGVETADAVRLGLQRSGRIITSAALLMIIVFAGFATADLLVMKQVGVALTIAIAVDATIVRMLLVPATMSVLGPLNWWAPRRLRRWHDRWGIVG
jgi:RND superfamily putative drug exporter